MTNAGHTPLRTGFRSFRWASTTTKTPLSALVLGLIGVMGVWLAVAQLTARGDKNPPAAGNAVAAAPQGPQSHGEDPGSAVGQAPTSADPKVEADRKLQAALADLDHDLADVPDGEGFKESAGYLVALRRVADMDPDALSRVATQTLDREALLADPGAFRGLPFSKMGIVSNIWAVKLRDGDQVGLTDTWRGILTEPDAEEGILFDIPVPPPKMRYQRDVVHIEGVFYRIAKYEAESGTKTVPYLLVRNIKLPDTAKLQREFQVPTGLYLVVGVLALVWVAFRVATWRKRSITSSAELQSSIRLHARRTRVLPERPPEPPNKT